MFRNRLVKRNLIGINLSKVRLHLVKYIILCTFNKKLKFIVLLQYRCDADTFEGYETHSPSESQKQYNPDYVYQSSDQTLQPYPNAVDDFTISCNGQNKICVTKSLCIDGYVHPLKQGFIRPGQVR